MSLEKAILLSSMLLSFACLLQSLEYFQVAGCLRGQLLRGTPSLLKLFSLGMGVSAIANLALPSGMGTTLLAATHLGILYLFRGPFNGGSDYQIAQGLLCTSLAQTFPGLAPYAIGYWGAQTFLSYWIAGFVKAKHRGWWNGSFLSRFLLESSYRIAPNLRSHAHSLSWRRTLSWAVLIWELGAPVIFLGGQFTIGYLVIALVFHLGIFWTFGLNRFFWSWLCSYPALLFLAN